MHALLVRVGIDATSGGWNAPVDPVTGRFVFVPISEDPQLRKKEFEHHYTELEKPLLAFGQHLPEHLKNKHMHLDPDFTHLTYGDRHPRDLPIRELEPGDFLVFYAGLRSIRPADRHLIYAIIGFFTVREVVRAGDIPKARWHENAHTRRAGSPDDLVVRAEPGHSGRLGRCLPIGEYRSRAYRVRPDLLEAWGGISVKDGYLQRSGRLPRFLEPERFMEWFADQKPVFSRDYF
jgi:hypothetical protein